MDQTHSSQQIKRLVHDLLGPLRTVVNYLQLLEMEGPESGNAEKYIARAVEGSLQMKNRIEELARVPDLDSIYPPLEKIEVKEMRADRDRKEIGRLKNPKLSFSQRSELYDHGVK